MPAGESIDDRIGDETVKVRFEKDKDLFTIEKEDGTPVPVVRAYWFAWQAFYPETELWQPEGNR